MIPPTLNDYMNPNDMLFEGAGIVPAPASQIRIMIYENAIPAFAEMALEQLYQNLYSSLVYLRASGLAGNLSTYVASINEQPLAIFLFRIQKRTVHVVNHVIPVAEAEVERFSHSVFARFPSIQVIAFQSLYTDAQVLSFPFQRCNVSEDIVLTLPSSPDSYLASLGKNTRKNVKYYLNRVKRSFPSFQYQLLEREQVTPAQVHDILQLKTGRLAERNITSAFSAAEIARTLQLVRDRGLVGIISIDGKICAGSIGYRIGTHVFGGVLAHDLEYDGYWIGMLCCFLTICDSITLGCKEYHFLWGRDEYKFRMLGEQRDLDDLTVYRSRIHCLRNPGTVYKAAVRGYSRRMRLWLNSARKSETVYGRLLAAVRRRQKTSAPDTPAG